MQARKVFFAFALCLLTATICLAQDPQLGTWKLNEAKSKLAAGVTKNHTVTYEAVGDQTKVTVDGTDASGAATHNEWTGKFDGKYYAVTGDPTSDERSYRRVNKRVLTLTARKGGKVTLTGRIVVSPNGKMRTITTNGTDANGKKFKQTGVYDKE